MAGCGGTKRDGRQCTVTVEPPNTYCWAHDPSNAEQRKRAAAKGGRSRVGGDVKDLRLQLQQLTERVVSGALETGRGAVANQLITTQIKLLEYERRVRETDELANRLEELERDIGEDTKGGRRWGR